MQPLKIQITGMTCDHCAAHLEQALNALDGVSASVSYDDALAILEVAQEITHGDLLATIESAGYSGRVLNSSLRDNRSSNADEGLHIAIVGTGSGAFAAAITAAERGARVTIVEGAEVIGGTCVNVGCVPSKIMIRGGQIAYDQSRHHFEGIAPNRPRIDRKAMVQQQQAMVDALRYAKYEHILDTNPGITLIKGMARFKNADTLIVTAADGSTKEMTADRILLAVGARAAIPPIDGLAETPYWTSTEALVAEQLPEHLVVLGGSVVALELAQAFRHLGSEVTVMARSTLLSKEDPDIGAALKPILEDEGINIALFSVPDNISHDGKTFSIRSITGDISCDRLLVATGRRSNADTLALENAGVSVAGNGAIIVDDHMRTNKKNIYAAGDCTNQPQYVYVAAAAGTRAARNMTGDNVKLDLSAMPAVVFTNPQVATVGMTEQQAIAQGINVQSRKLDLDNVPRALANMDTRGFIKLVAEQSSGRILGCQVLASNAGEVIQSAAIAISNNMTVQDLSDQLFPYLTMVEGLKLTAQTFNKDVSQLSCCAG